MGLKAISTELVREYGYTTGMVQVGIDHRQFAKQKYLQADWTLMYPDVNLIDNGKAYLFEKKFSENKTAFVISKSQLEQLSLRKTERLRSEGPSLNNDMRLKCLLSICLVLCSGWACSPGAPQPSVPQATKPAIVSAYPIAVDVSLAEHQKPRSVPN